MKKITFLLLVSFLLFSCEKPEDLTSSTDPEAPEVTMPVNFTITVTNVSVFDGANGSISILPSSGIAPLQYKIGTGEYQTADRFDNLKAGTYTVTAKDTKNTTCSKTAVITQPTGPEIPPTPALLFTLVPTNVNIYGFQTGSIAVSVTSGVPPYSYSIGATTNSTGIFSNLYAGTYNVTVTDSKQQALTLSTTITQPDKKLIYSVASASAGTQLSQYLNTFSGRNRFSIAFRYTAGAHVNSNGSNYNTATLFAIDNYPSDPTLTTGSLEINLISTGGSENPSIFCKRFSYVFGQGSYNEANSAQIWNYDSNVWKGAYVVLTYDGTNMKFYLNGVLMGTTGNGANINGTVESTVGINASKIYLGTSGKSDWVYDDFFGSFTNVKIYNEALTPADVAGLN